MTDSMLENGLIPELEEFNGSEDAPPEDKQTTLDLLDNVSLVLSCFVMVLTYYAIGASLVMVSAYFLCSVWLGFYISSYRSFYFQSYFVDLFFSGLSLINFSGVVFLLFIILTKFFVQFFSIIAKPKELFSTIQLTSNDLKGKDEGAEQSKTTRLFVSIFVIFTSFIIVYQVFIYQNATLIVFYLTFLLFNYLYFVFVPFSSWHSSEKHNHSFIQERIDSYVFFKFIISQSLTESIISKCVFGLCVISQIVLSFIKGTKSSIIQGVVVFLIGPYLVKVNLFTILSATPSKDEEDDELDYQCFCYSMKGFKIALIAFAIVLGLLSCLWGFDFIWKSPVKIYSSKLVNSSLTNGTYDFKPINSQFCYIESYGMDIIQLSGLPMLMYFVNREKDYKTPLNFYQQSNINSTVNLLFGDLSSHVHIHDIYERSISITVPGKTEDVLVSVFGGFRSPYDWSLFFEIVIEKYIEMVFKSLIPFYQTFQIMSSTLFGLFKNVLFYGLDSGPFVFSQALTQAKLIKNNTQLVIGQGIGGFYAKWVSEKFFVYAFDSLSPDGSLFEEKTRLSILNVHSSGLYSEYDPSFPLNFRRYGHYSVFPNPSSFYTFCNTVAMCSTTKRYHSFCEDTIGSKFVELLDRYDRINSTTINSQK